jgi:hypothetical protein
MDDVDAAHRIADEANRVFERLGIPAETAEGIERGSASG